MMKTSLHRALLGIIPLLTLTQLKAEESPDSSFVSILDEMPYVMVNQADTLTQILITNMREGQVKGIHINGYRVQIYSSNLQQTAREEALQLEQELTPLIDEPLYIQYDSPFWKVRIGNFRTVDKAREYKDYLINLFPKIKQNAYVVRDIIKL